MVVLRPSDGRPTSELGSKATALALAGRAGLPVPPWFAVAPSACLESVPPAIRAGAIREIEDAVNALCPNGELVAVRSSAADEDGSGYSFAGQFESHLNVATTDVCDRVRLVQRSAFSERVMRYRQEHGLGGRVRAPAVIVQRMVHPEFAGVAFSADPVTGRRGVAVVCAVHGLGASLVSGDADGSTYRVDRHGVIVSRAPEKRAEKGTAAFFDDEQVRAVAHLAREAARLFGCHQDIEWAMASGHLYLLQSRPITSLDRTPDEDGVVRLWDNSNIVESYGGITTPLTFSFAREAYEEVYRQFCRMMRVPDSIIADQDQLFRNMLGLIRGRVYYNLLNWYRLLAMLPGFAVNRRFMEQMMGVRERVPDALLPACEQPAFRRRLLDVVRLAGTIGGLALNYVRLDRRITRFYLRVEAALAPPDPPLCDQRADQISAYYDSLRRQLLKRWDAPILSDFFAMVFYGLLRDLATRWCGETSGSLQNDLIAGERGMISTQPAVRVQRLAALTARHKDFVELLWHGTAADILSRAREVPGFMKQFEAYLETFGERCTDELKLESATLRDDPLPLLRAIGQLAVREPQQGSFAEATPTDPAEVRSQAESRVNRALAGHPFRRAIFRWTLANARARVRDRENLRFVRTRVFGRVRRTFVELGARLHEAGSLDNPRDIFYLQVEEILGFVEGRAVTTDLKPLVAVRRAEFGAYANQPIPDSRFETRGAVHQGNAFAARLAADDHQAHGRPQSARQGLGCCPGIRRGPVRVVRDPATAMLGAGSILVAERTDPGWIMIFPAAAGLIVERGSPLSHSAIVARELGIPTIVSVEGVTAWLQDGDWVEMDGSTGIVRKLAA